MKDYAERFLGITNYDFKDSPQYNSQRNEFMERFLGAHWKYSTFIESSVDENNIHTVVIDWYADKICWAKAYTFKYMVQENDDGSFKMLSVEKLFGTGYEIAGGST